MVSKRKPDLTATTGKDRIYFCGTDEDSPPNLPNDTRTGSYSVRSFFRPTKNCIVNDTGDREDGVVITDPDKHVIAILPNKKSRASIFNTRTTMKIMDELLRGSPIGSKRSYGKEPLSTDSSHCRFSCLGPKCNRTKRGISKDNNKLTPEQRSELYRIITQAEQIMAGHLDPDYIKAHKDIMNKMKIPRFTGRTKNGTYGETTIFPNIAFGKNVYLPAHVDKDCIYSVVTICDSQFRYKPTTEILAYFCFPGKCPNISDPPPFLFS